MKIKLSNLFEDVIIEDLLNIGGETYPNGDNIVMFAGGSGSGKGFILKNLLGIEGKVFDTDTLKTLYLKNKKLSDSIMKNYGIDISQYDMKNPNHVTSLHHILSDKGIHDKRIEVFLKTVKDNDNKPNIIFDTTLSDYGKFSSIVNLSKDAGYKEENIHIVWVLTDFDVALKNNNGRDRVVPYIVFNDAHNGVSVTIKELLSDSGKLLGIDGDIILLFNTRKDTTLTKSDKGGQYVSKSNYTYLKRKGEKALSIEEINKDILDKINSYTPKETIW